MLLLEVVIDPLPEAKVKIHLKLLLGAEVKLMLGLFKVVLDLLLKVVLSC